MAKLEIEKELIDKNYKHICGVDEAGRGPLAGPVVVACVEMPLDNDKIIEEIDDSKKLSEKKREKLYEEIIKTAIQYKIAVVDNFVIDDINILEATKLGMNDVMNGMINPDIILIDAVQISDASCKTMSIIHGDALSYNIAAASIIAKVTRDRMMREFDKIYTGYGFSKHKGYGTKAHYEAIEKLGICPIHRLSFLKSVKIIKNNKDKDKNI